MLSAMLLVIAESCTNDDPEQDGVNTGKAINYFAKYGELRRAGNASANASVPEYDFFYSYDSKSRVTEVRDLECGERHLYEYSDQEVKFLKDEGHEGVIWYTLKGGRIVSARGPLLQGEWSYDSHGRVVKYSKITNRGEKRSYTCEWDGGNIASVRVYYENQMLELSVYKYMISFTYTDMPLKNPVTLVDVAKYSTRYFMMGMDPVLVAEGYFGNSAVKNLPASHTYLDEDGEPIDFRQTESQVYDLDENGRVCETVWYGLMNETWVCYPDQYVGGRTPSKNYFEWAE